MRDRFILATVLEVLGLVVVAVGVGLVYVPAGVIVGGLALAVIGYASGVDPKAGP